MRVLLVAMPLATALACAPLPHGPPGESSGTAQQPLSPAALDALIESSWRAARVTPVALADDGEILRRMTLDLLGRIPTLAETRAFLDDVAPDKRTRLADRLLASHEMAEHWGGLYADLLFGDEAKAAKLQKKYDPASWLVQAFEENRGFDRLVEQLITAKGDVRDNAAVAFIAARESGGGGPEAVAGAAARIFLGLQIQCAQCHDHPYDPRWKQEDFYGLVAFFARTRTKNEKIADQAPSMAAMADETWMLGKGKQAKTVIVFDAPKGEAKMRRPHSEVEETVRPRFLGAALTQKAWESRRQTLARAIVGSDLFAKATVGRTWSALFGRGIVDPWDDLGAPDDPRHPPLLLALASDFVASHHDFKHLLRTLVLSTAYARSAAIGGDDGDAAARAFARSAVRPLSPEPLFQSLLVATGAEEMARRHGGPDPEKRVRQSFKEYQFVFADDEMAQADRFDGSVPQALLLMNGELTNKGARADEGGALAGILAGSKDPARRLEDMFLTAYGRPPRPAEQQRLLEYLRAQRNARAAYEDLFFALVTSTEAITNH